MTLTSQQFTDLFGAFMVQLPDVDAGVLHRSLQRRALGGGEVLIRAGERSDALSLLVSGTLTVTASAPDGSTVELAVLHPGAAVGEVSLLDPGKATATVSASHGAEVLTLTGEGLDAMWRSHPRAASSLVRGLSAVIAERIRSTHAELDASDGTFGGSLRRLLGWAA